MARHDIKLPKDQKILSALKNKLQPKPIVIPRDKLEIAHLKVKTAQNKVKYLLSIIVLELLIIGYLLSK